MARDRAQLETYLVGGAVRDRLLGIAPGDRDWVVVGSSVEEMLALGFRQVGRDFPVFIDPGSGEEYALARSERKTGPGYHGFEFDFHPGTTLEQDLARRDLTMNAIAMDAEGALIDPYGGEQDIRDRRIRHVTDAFRQDPVRILRAARFAARFGAHGFEVADDTRALMRAMVEAGEADALVPERVWQEVHATFGQGDAARFVTELRECGALAVILPEVDALFGIPQTKKYHPEVDTGVHTLLCLAAVQALTRDPVVIFAVLVHDLGKALTPAEILPSHRGHEQRGLAPIKGLCDRLGVPGRFRDFALKVCRHHLEGHRIAELKPATVLTLLEAFDAFRGPEPLEGFIECCLADRRGRTGHEDDPPGSLELLRAYRAAALAVRGGEVAAALQADNPEVPGKRIAREIRRRRLAALSAVRREHREATAA